MRWEQPVIDDPRRQAQHQRPRLQLRQRLLQTPMATATAAVTRGIEASGALMEVSTLWLSTMGQRISTSSTGRPGTGAGTKALPPQQIQHIAVFCTGQRIVQGAGILPPQCHGKHLRQQQLPQLPLLVAVRHPQSTDEQRPTPGLLPHIAGELQTPQPVIQLTGLQLPGS